MRDILDPGREVPGSNHARFNWFFFLARKLIVTARSPSSQGAPIGHACAHLGSGQDLQTAVHQSAKSVSVRRVQKDRPPLLSVDTS